MKTHRNLAVAASVLLLHVGAVWALQSGLVRRAVESVVPETIMAVLIAPEPPPVVKPAEPPPRPAEAPKPVARKVAPPPPAPAPAPAPLPVAKPTPDPAPQAPTAATTQVALAPLTQPVAPPAPPAPPVVVAKAAPAAPVELPSTDADYLQNPRPAYPAISRKLREQGKVVVDVLIGADGSAQQAKVTASSGFDRLDAAALATVQRWRYVPGKKGGVATAMWFSVPINFVLE